MMQRMRIIAPRTDKMQGIFHIKTLKNPTRPRKEQAGFLKV